MFYVNRYNAISKQGKIPFEDTGAYFHVGMRPSVLFSSETQPGLIRARARQWPYSLPRRAAAGSCPENNKHSRRAPVERQAFGEGKRGHPSVQEMPGPALLDMKWFGLYAQSASEITTKACRSVCASYSPGPE